MYKVRKMYSELSKSGKHYRVRSVMKGLQEYIPPNNTEVSDHDLPLPLEIATCLPQGVEGMANHVDQASFHPTHFVRPEDTSHDAAKSYPWQESHIQGISREPEQSRPDLKAKLGFWKCQHNCITNSALTDLLKILRECGHEDLPTDYRSLMQTPRNVSSTFIDVDPGKYVHLGLAAQLRHCIEVHFEKLPACITLNIGIDGVPITNSSGSSFWPILGLIVDETVKLDPIVIGCYHGEKKPKDANNFLQTFVDEAKDLLKQGLSIDDYSIDIKIKAFSCDAPALSFIKCTKYFNGFYGCPKCTIKGKSVGGKVTFPSVNKCQRNDSDFRDKVQKEHHSKHTSYLEKLPIDMIHCFPIDYQHNACLGNMRKIIRIIKHGKEGVKIKKKDLLTLEHNILKIQKCVPSEFARKIRSPFEVGRWKATEARQFALYIGIVLLRHTMIASQYEHFLNFSLGLRILCDPNLCITFNGEAKLMLNNYVRGFAKYYGKRNITYNVHCSSHLADDVLNLGALDNYSTFPFENFLQKIKKKIKPNDKPLEQLTARLAEESFFSRKSPTTLYPVVKRKSDVHSAESHGTIEYVQFEGFLLSKKWKDNVCLLQDNRVAIVKDFVEVLGEVKIKIQRFNVIQPLFARPIDSLDLGIGIVNLESLSNEVIIELSVVKKKMVKVPYAEEKVMKRYPHKYTSFVVLPLMHTEV